jgi:lysophospholipase L1-like esterase
MHDNDNEGHSGFRINQIHEVMGKALEMRPNIVLLHAGTNDLNREEIQGEAWADAPERLGNLLDEVLRVCPDAVVMVAQIIQAAKAQTATNIKAFNDAIPGLVQERFAKGFKAVAVDHSIVGVAELIDGLHP